MEQKLLSLHGHLNSPLSIVWGSLCLPEFTPQVLCGVRYARSLLFSIVFCAHCLYFFYSFSLGYDLCFLFFDLRIPVTPF